MITETRLSIFDEEDAPSRGTQRMLGFWNGLFIGLALALGVWGSQAATLSRLPIAMPYASLVAAGILAVLLCAFTGWLTARSDNAIVSFALWLVTAMLLALVVSSQGNQIRTLMVWLADRRYWGRPVFQGATLDSAGLTILSQLLAGFFLILLLVVLALIQEYRLEGLQGTLSKRRRPTLTTFFRLLLPMPFVAVAGLITSNIVGGGAATEAFQVVNEAIQTGRTYEGNLLELSQERGVNYNAIRGVRDQMSADYTLALGGVDPASDTTFVVADFSNGAWISCRVISGQLSFCYDASPPYTVGLSSLLSGEPPPETCRGCLPRTDEALAAWLRDQAGRFGGRPQISRVSQWGGTVLMRAESAAGDTAIECWFSGLVPVRLQSCAEVEQ